MKTPPSQHDALPLLGNVHSTNADELYSLGNQLFAQFHTTWQDEHLDEAIRAYEDAANCLSVDDPRRGGFLTDTAVGYCTRYVKYGKIEELQAAIAKLRIALPLIAEDDPIFPVCLSSLATALSLRFERTGDLEDISEAIRNEQRAIELAPHGHGVLPARLNNLGVSFSRRFERTGDLDDVSEAIRHQQRAIHLSPEGSANLTAQFSNLGISFVCRFERTGNLDDVSEAIRNHQCAVQHTADGDPGLPGRLDNLGNAISSRFDHTQDLDDISEAIEHQRRAVQLTPDGHAGLPTHLLNLGISFRSRFESTKDLNDLAQAIQNQQLAVQLAPDEHTGLAGALNDLGISFMRRFEHTGHLDDISEAVRHQQRAVQLIPDGHARLPIWLNNLGNSYSGRFKCTGNLDDISEAIRLIQRSIQLTPDGHAGLSRRLCNLGNSFVYHFKATKLYESLVPAVSLYRHSATSPLGSPSTRLYAATKWAAISTSHPSLFRCEQLAAHACVIQLLSLISGLGYTVQHRNKTLLENSRLSIDVSAAALSFGDPEKAVEWLVQGRCIVWNQINQLRTPVDEIRSYDPALADRFCLLSRQLEMAGLRMGSHGARPELSMDEKISLEDEARTHIKQAEQWERLLDSIRSIPGFEDFLQPRRLADIMRRLPEEGPVIVINIHRDRCDALALMAGAEGPMHIPLIKISYNEIDRLAHGLRRYLLATGVRSRLGVPLDEDGSPTPLVDLQEVLNALWTNMVCPILEELAFFGINPPDKLPRIWWCPTGPLAFLPIHAAGIYDNGTAVPKQTLSEFAVSSYIPTVNVLLGEGSNPTSKACNRRNGLLMVSVSRTLTPRLSSIPFASEEVQKVQKRLDGHPIPSATLDDEEATVDRVSELMEEFSCIHLACHASQNMSDPLESSIYLYDGPFKLSEIMRMNLTNAEFAFLSACQTSKGDERLAEEVVHLASGMLAAGYRSVVGTMWSIYDKHGADLADFFYESLLLHNSNADLPVDGRPEIVEGRGAARALHDATRRVRDKVSDPFDSFLAWVPYILIGI